MENDKTIALLSWEVFVCVGGGGGEREREKMYDRVSPDGGGGGSDERECTRMYDHVSLAGGWGDGRGECGERECMIVSH